MTRILVVDDEQQLLRALAGFLRVDADLLDTAAEASAEPRAEAGGHTALAVDQWINGLTTGE